MYATNKVRDYWNQQLGENNNPTFPPYTSCGFSCTCLRGGDGQETDGSTFVPLYSVLSRTFPSLTNESSSLGLQLARREVSTEVKTEANYFRPLRQVHHVQRRARKGKRWVSIRGTYPSHRGRLPWSKHGCCTQHDNTAPDISTTLEQCLGDIGDPMQADVEHPRRGGTKSPEEWKTLWNPSLYTPLEDKDILAAQPAS